jgi:histidinol-phosphate/aromatic aminotransferase/cobyric acid decarboxylase-like protein
MVVDRPTPTGRVDTASALVPVLRVAERLDVIVVIEESYADYLRPGASTVALTERHDNLVVVGV